MALEQKISGGKLKEKVSDAVDFLAKQNIFTFEDKPLGHSPLPPPVKTQ